MKNGLKSNSVVPTFIIILMVVSLITIAAPIFFYVFNFTGGLSNNQTIWGSFGGYFGGIVSPILSFFSFMTALYLIVKNRQMDKFNQIYEFMKDYRSRRMSNDLKLLWDFYIYRDYRNKTGEYNENERLIELQKNYVKEHEKTTEIYFARRNVSFFFYYLSIFFQHNRLDNDILFTLWPSSAYTILSDIIIPCEKVIPNQDIQSNKLDIFNSLIESARKYSYKN